MIHSTVNLFVKDCSYSKKFGVFYTIYTLTIAGLFINFYFKTYTSKNDNLKNKSK